MSVLPGLFVTGTDTGVGKTRVAAAIARCLAARGQRVGVLKPLATGAERHGDAWSCGDAEALIEAAGGGIPLERVAPILYEEPLAPSVAARRAGEPLDRAVLLESVGGSLGWWTERADVVVIEGVGGFLTPVAEEMTVADLAVALDYPLVIVARRGLGTLNHSLMTLECARRRGLRIACLVLNSAEPLAGSVAEATNAEELARIIEDVAILNELPFHDDPRTLAVALDGVDWYDRCRRPRDPGLLVRGAEPADKSPGENEP